MVFVWLRLALSIYGWVMFIYVIIVFSFGLTEPLSVLAEYTANTIQYRDSAILKYCIKVNEIVNEINIDLCSSRNKYRVLSSRNGEPELNRSGFWLQLTHLG